MFFYKGLQNEYEQEYFQKHIF